MDQCSVPDPFLMKQKRSDSMKKSQELMGEVLDNANIPALSLSLCQKGTCYAVASGSTDTSAPNPVDTNTLFQIFSVYGLHYVYMTFLNFSKTFVTT